MIKPGLTFLHFTLSGTEREHFNNCCLVIAPNPIEWLRPIVYVEAKLESHVFEFPLPENIVIES
jgi:hypothetical protein